MSDLGILLQNLIITSQQIKNLYSHLVRFRRIYSQQIIYWSPFGTAKNIWNMRLKNQHINIQEQFEGFSNGERRLLNWIIVVYCKIHSVQLEALAGYHLEILRELVGRRSSMRIQYQLQGLKRGRINRKCTQMWTNEESQMLLQIVKQLSNEMVIGVFQTILRIKWQLSQTFLGMSRIMEKQPNMEQNIELKKEIDLLTRFVNRKFNKKRFLLSLSKKKEKKVYGLKQDRDERVNREKVVNAISKLKNMRLILKSQQQQQSDSYRSICYSQMIRRQEIFFNEYSNYLKENEDPNRDPWKSLPFILVAESDLPYFRGEQVYSSDREWLNIKDDGQIQRANPQNYYNFD